MYAIEISSLTKEIPTGGGVVSILRGVDLLVPAGQSVAIMGPSGSGKSTLLGIVAGFDSPTSGRISLAGEDITTLDEDGLARLRSRTLGFVFQAYNLIGNLTAEENVALPLELAGDRSGATRARELLQAVGLGERGHHYPAQLSGGEQQRVALARAFAPRPKILLADEPTGNLDSENGALVMDLLSDLHRSQGATLVLVTHDPKLAERAERVVTLRDGRIVSDTAPTGVSPQGGDVS